MDADSSNSDVDLSETNAEKLISTATTFLILSWVSVALRTYTRAVLMKGLQLDDWLMLLGQAVFTVYAGFLFAGVHSGIGRHNDAIIDDERKVLALKWQALAISTYILLMMFIKLSIGVFLMRLAVQKVYIWILRISLVVIAIWSIVIFFWNLFQCSPVDKQWDYRITTGQCVSAGQIVSAAYALSAMTVVSDWLYALLPIPMLWKVKMSNQAKITVILILSLGIFASVATLVRIRFLPDMENTDDILYAGTDAMVWTIIEPGLAIVASSLATIRPLLRAMRIRGFDSTQNNSGNSKPGQNQQQQQQVPLQNVARPPQQQYGLDDLAFTASDRNVAAGAAITTRGGESDKSEVFIIQGAVVDSNQAATSTWGRRSEDDRSMGQIHDLEAQSQENVPSGLGSESER